MHLTGLLQKFFLKHKYFFLFFICVGFWLFLFYFLDKEYRVQTIEVVGTSELDSITGTLILQNKYIWLIDKQVIMDNLNKTNSLYQITKIHKQYPSTLTIFVRRLYPAAYLQVANGFLVLSKEGRILHKHRSVENESLPIISYYQDIPYTSYHAGSEIDKKDVADVLYFIEVIKGAKEKVVRIDIAGYHMLGLYTDEHEYLFSSEKKRELQLYQFEEALKQFQIQGTKYSSIDFRFDKPVVKF